MTWCCFCRKHAVVNGRSFYRKDCPDPDNEHGVACGQAEKLNHDNRPVIASFKDTDGNEWSAADLMRRAPGLGGMD